MEKDEALELDLGHEKRLCSQYGIKFIQHPIPDRGIPKDVRAFLELIDTINNQLHKGENVVIYCRMGIGRTGMTAAAVLLKNGFALGTVFTLLSGIRTLEIPDTQGQVEFIKRLGLMLEK